MEATDLVSVKHLSTCTAKVKEHLNFAIFCWILNFTIVHLIHCECYPLYSLIILIIRIPLITLIIITPNFPLKNFTTFYIFLKLELPVVLAVAVACGYVDIHVCMRGCLPCFEKGGGGGSNDGSILLANSNKFFLMDRLDLQLPATAQCLSLRAYTFTQDYTAIYIEVRYKFLIRVICKYVLFVS